jgi:hypothetical protein
MRKTRFALIAAAAGAMLACVAFLLLVRTPPPNITLHFSKTHQLNDSRILVTFEVRNPNSYRCTFIPERVETNGTSWKECAGALRGFPRVDRANQKLAVPVKQLPAGTHARVVLKRLRERSGLNSFVFRFNLLLIGPNRSAAFAPFGTLFYDDPIEVVSEEFTFP